MSERRTGETKYAPLLTYLAARAPTEQTVTLAFAAIEQVLGCLLPASAWTTQFWTGGRDAQRLWQAHGWRARIDRHAHAVVFTRSQP